MIHLVTGKGGVGKSLTAAALAKSLAMSGRKTLLVELGERSYLRHLFGVDVSAEQVEISSSLTLTRWEGEVCLREYLVYLLKIERMVKLFFDNKIMRALVQAAPALKELALLGKITSGPRQIGPPLQFDEVVVDAFATGHFRALWRAPVGLAEAIPFGPMGEQSRSIVAVMKNPDLTRYYVCVIPEELPVTEGLELARDIQNELGQKSLVIVNRFLETEIAPSTLEREPDAKRAPDFIDYLKSVLARQAEAIKLVAQSGFASFQLPWLLELGPREKVEALAERLGDRP